MLAKQRFVTFAYLALTTLLGLLLEHGVAFAQGRLGWADTPLFGLQDLPLSRVVGMGLAASTAVGLAWLPKSATWINEVADELLRVSWPSRDETVHATGVVIVCVVISAAFLGLFDATWLWMSNTVMGVVSAGGG